MNLVKGEQVVQVLIASKSFGEINPDNTGLQQLELFVKKNQKGSMDAEMRIGYETGTLTYSFSDIGNEDLPKIRSTLDMYSRVTNQPGVFREYDFSDCRDDEEMWFRILSIPEYRAQTKLPRDKVISLENVKDTLKCPICGHQVSSVKQKCVNCGIYTYKGDGNRYFESERASFNPVFRHGEKDASVHICKIDYINKKSHYSQPHITYLEEMPAYLGAIYTFTPPTKPAVFYVVLNKPRWFNLTEDLYSTPYQCRKVDFNDLESLKENGATVFCGTGTEPNLLVSFEVCDYTCLEEIGSHINFILYKYNSHIEKFENLM